MATGAKRVDHPDLMPAVNPLGTECDGHFTLRYAPHPVRHESEVLRRTAWTWLGSRSRRAMSTQGLTLL